MNHHSQTAPGEHPERIAQLIAGYIRQTLSPGEHDELDIWVAQSDENMRLFEELTDENYLEAGLEQMNRIDTEGRLQEVKKHLEFSPAKGAVRRSRRWAYGVAAALLLAIAAIFLLNPGKKTGEIELAKQILPPANNTTLRLSDGKVVSLSDMPAHTRLSDQGTEISKTAGLLQYNTAEATSGAYFNTLVTARGSQYRLVLPDGSRVWLNAESSLKFPLAFAGAERRVQLQGEAYFEIAHDAARPFRVELAEGADIKVLGTHFNVRSYADEAASTVSLLEGSVAVTMNDRQQLLRPGQQLRLHHRGMQLSAFTEPAAVNGWKDGLFVFRGAEIETIMREIQKWYEARIVYEGKVTDEFTATISRQEPLSKLLHLLEQTGKVKFRTENNTVYVLR